MTAVVRVRDLSVAYREGGGTRRVVHDAGFDIHAGEALGLVGASGSGKSTIALALTRCLVRGAEMTARQLEVAGSDVLSLSGEALRRYRRDDIGVVFQEPGRALNPTATIGAQVAETHLARGAGRGAAATAATAALDEVGLPDPEVIAKRYPHELSGGQQQRAMIAIALAARPRLLILDEPTTGLDTVAQAEILALVDGLRAALGFASLLISHDLELVAAHTDRVRRLDDGRLLEASSAGSLHAEPGAPVEPGGPRERVTLTTPRPSRELRDPDLPPVVEGTGLAKRFGSVTALDSVDLRISRGETLGLVGASGSGKTTLGRVIAGLTSHAGDLRIHAPSPAPPVQMVFQSPDASLNPRRTVRQTLGRSIRLLEGVGSVDELAARTGIPGDVLDRLPGELSGGQRQRVAIARAFAGRSALVVCDEPTSALDAPLRATILDLLVELQEQTGTAYLFISHDLAVVRRVAHRVAVMRGGRIVETVPAAAFFDAAEHPYSRSLIAASRQLSARAGRAAHLPADDKLY